MLRSTITGQRDLCARKRSKALRDTCASSGHLSRRTELADRLKAVAEGQPYPKRGTRRISFAVVQKTACFLPAPHRILAGSQPECLARKRLVSHATQTSWRAIDDCVGDAYGIDRRNEACDGADDAKLISLQWPGDRSLSIFWPGLLPNKKQPLFRARPAGRATGAEGAPTYPIRFHILRVENLDGGLIPSRPFSALITVGVPYRIEIVLTDNGVQFADLPKNRLGPTARLRRHAFDRACREHGIEHRLTKPNNPWTTDVIDKCFLAGSRLFYSGARVTARRRAGREAQALPRSIHCRPSFAAPVRACLGPRGFQPATKRA
jgi:hypothetical protein